MTTRLKPEWLDWPQTGTLLKAFRGRPGSLRFVGGAVRDALLGRVVTDVDAATTLPPAETTALLAAAGITALPTGIEHGTVTAAIDKKHFEITTLRKDVATDGRHAEIAYTNDWKEDAARRDFTMNALYLSPEGELTDYFSGADDAKAGRVQFIGEAARRIEEDHLRILRFFRFHAWYGRGEPDAQALAACNAAAAQLATLSGERIRQEMLKLLAAPRPFATLELMKETVLRHAFGFPVHNTRLIEALERLEGELSLAPDPLLRLALLLPSAASLDHVTQKWKLSNEVDKRLALLLAHVGQVKPEMEEAAQKKLLRKLGPEPFKALALLRWAQQPEAADSFRAMRRLADEWILPVFPVAGKDLQALGIPEGRRIGELLRQLEEEWEKSDYQLTKKELLAQAKEYSS